LRIHNGNIETQVELTGNNDEIDEVYSTLNTMITNITQLKMQSYEIGIAKQKIELQYLRLHSIKYALLPNRTLVIDIQATVQHFDDKSALHICVRDNGPGYPCEMLAEIQASEPEFYENHVGLGNLKRRLNLLFDDHATFYFSNLPAGGANSDIIIPIKTVPGTDPKED